MATIRFYPKKTKGATAHIMASFSHGSGTPPTLYIGFSIPANKIKGEYKYWNKKQQRARDCDDVDKINAKLTTWENTFDTYVSDCKLAGTSPSMQFIMAQIDGTYKTKAGGIPTLLSVLDSFKTSIKKTHGIPAQKSYAVLENDIIDFQKHTGSTYTVMDIDHAWYNKFVTYLLSEENNFNAIINKKQGRLANVLKYAVETLKYKVNPDYDKKYKLKTVQASKFPLQPEELATLWSDNTDARLQRIRVAKDAFVTAIERLEDPRQTRVRIKLQEALTNANSELYHWMCLDAFLLATETGMRYSDITQLKPMHIISHVLPDGAVINFAAVTQIKTDDIAQMALSDKAMQIINRYTTDDKYAPLFKFSASQAVGKILKAIFKDKDLTRPCEIIQKKGGATIREIKPLHDVISFHMARNTYITRLLKSKLAPVHVQENAGHSKLEVTMGYFRNEDIERHQATLAILNAPKN